ncbi:uncharacterized protein LOC115067366 isoform X2 [Nannospalax galili]|uniref:uncharacterized protein LOC115067366 isoform X2 n=1 Tax=Nannospalax galili TaxID=1026970 RepID=UPI00111C8A02|nr:uncharacterized protein LOC115067366 isoform X2 [Nannospalax galili]
MKFFSVTFGGECSHSCPPCWLRSGTRSGLFTWQGVAGTRNHGAGLWTVFTVVSKPCWTESLQSAQRMPTLMAVRRPCNTMLRGTTGPSARGVHSGSGITLLELLNDGHIPAPTVAPGGQRASQGQLVRDCHGRSKRPLKRDQKEHRKETRHHISAAGVRRTKTLPLRTVGSLKGRLCVAVSRLFTSTHTSSLKPD